MQGNFADRESIIIDEYRKADLRKYIFLSLQFWILQPGSKYNGMYVGQLFQFTVKSAQRVIDE